MKRPASLERAAAALVVGCAATLAMSCRHDGPSEVRRSGGALTDAATQSPFANAGNADAHDGGGPLNIAFDAGPDGSLPNPCERIEVTALDLIFMVDNSRSMLEEQEALQREFPRLIEILTTGDTDGDGVEDFPAVEDLHLGVVSSDMGLVSIPGIPGCDGLGDDGILNNVPSTLVSGCQATYPRFLTYVAGADDVATKSNDFACIATLGTEGCGFEQPLEAVLKALWPSADDRVRFLGDSMGFGRLGHGDIENVSFLRDPAQTPAALAIVVVTDEEDCSSADTSHFLPDVYLDPNNPTQAALAMQDLNLRCFYNPQNLYPVSRYAPTVAGETGHPSEGGYRNVRAGNEPLVFFAAIVGVPVDLVDDTARAAVDFADETQREQYYEALLDDERMQPMVDTSLPPGQGNLVPSCVSDNDGDGTNESRAYPPRRIVEVARRFGQNGIVQSICQSDFGTAVEQIARGLGSTIDRACQVN